jgi:LacI family transcriptional regulator
MRPDAQVSPATREAVLAAIKQLNYEPHQSARNLSSTFPKVIGLVISRLPSEIQASKAGYEYMAALYRGAAEVCNRSGYELMVQEVGTANSIQVLVRRVRSRNVGGYVVAAPATEFGALGSTLAEEHIPHATINPMAAVAGVPTVSVDDRRTVRALVDMLIARGHARIAYVGTTIAMRATRERLAGYKDALRAAKIGLDKRYVLVGGIEFEDGLRAGRQLLALADRPTAVQCLTDDLAAGVLAAAHEASLALPSELSVCGFDDFGLARKLWPALTTAQLPAEQLAALACQQVIDKLEGRHPQDHCLPCSLSLRSSVGPGPRTA